MNERNWTEYRLAKESGLSQSTIANMYKRNTVPSVATLEAICKAFCISLSQFFADGQEAIVLDEEQREMLDIWNTLNREQKAALLGLLKAM